MLLCIPFEMDGACALCSLGNINTHSSYCGVQFLRYIVYDMCVYRMRWNNPDRPIHKDYSWVFFVSSFLSSISVAGLLLVLLFFLPLLKASLRRLHFFHAMVVIQTPKIYKHSASDSVFGDIVDYRSTHSTIVQLLNNCCRQRSRFYYSLWWIVLQPNIRWFFPEHRTVGIETNRSWLWFFCFCCIKFLFRFMWKDSVWLVTHEKNVKYQIYEEKKLQKFDLKPENQKK